MNPYSDSRIFGLDILRSAAILLVVFSHSSFLLESYTLFPWISLPDGVDIFFVLSGFLIGGMLIDILNKENEFGFHSVKSFLKRRWFRTLPNYFLVLLLNIVLIKFDLIQGFINKYLVTYFFFFQNFHKPYDFLFWESWSLSVEEWFYLLFPFVILFFFRIIKDKQKVFLFAILSFLVFPLIYRITQVNPATDFDLYTRKLVLTRLDTIGYGILMAYFYKYHRELFLKKKITLFVIGFASMMFLVNIDRENNFFFQTVFYSCLGLSIAALFPFMVTIKEERIKGKPFRFTSIISYSLYLLHVPLLQITANGMREANPLIIFTVFWILSYFFSWLLYKFYEKPMMDLREKF